MPEAKRSNPLLPLLIDASSAQVHVGVPSSDGWRSMHRSETPALRSIFEGFRHYTAVGSNPHFQELISALTPEQRSMFRFPKIGDPAYTPAMLAALEERYPGFDTDEKLEVVHALATRPSYGWRLTQAIKSNRVPRRDVPAYVARQLRRVVGSGFVEINPETRRIRG